MEEYKNTFWTRLIAVDGFQAMPNNENGYHWALGPDLIEECNFVAELPAVDPDEYPPLYDPNAFNKAHGPLEIEKFRLPQDDLKAWALRVIKLR